MKVQFAGFLLMQFCVFLDIMFYIILTKLSSKIGRENEE
jgi:hypothetical protein